MFDSIVAIDFIPLIYVLLKLAIAGICAGIIIGTLLFIFMMIINAIEQRIKDAKN